jgi:hypothetical protein
LYYSFPTLVSVQRPTHHHPTFLERSRRRRKILSLLPPSCTNAEKWKSNGGRFLGAATKGSDDNDVDSDYDEDDEDDYYYYNDPPPTPKKQPSRKKRPSSSLSSSSSLRPPKPVQVQGYSNRPEEESARPKTKTSPNPMGQQQPRVPVTAKGATLDRYSNQEEEDYDDYDERDDDDDYDDEDDDKDDGGNYWWNPSARYDTLTSPKLRQRIPRPDKPPRMRPRPKPRNDLPRTDRKR